MTGRRAELGAAGALMERAVASPGFSAETRRRVESATSEKTVGGDEFRQRYRDAARAEKLWDERMRAAPEGRRAIERAKAAQGSGEGPPPEPERQPAPAADASRHDPRVDKCDCGRWKTRGKPRCNHCAGRIKRAAQAQGAAAVPAPGSEATSDRRGPPGLSRIEAVTVAAEGLRFIPAWSEACRLELVPVARLYVRAAYQRELGAKGARRVRRIAEAFDWARFGALVVAEAGDGFEVIDGQHRAAAARSRGVARVPAIVVSGEAAATFLGLNRDRLNLDATQLYHAERAAGGEEAVALDRVLGAVGVSVPRVRAWAARAAMQTNSVGVMRAELRRHGAEVLEQALRVIASAWGDTPGVFRSHMIRAMCRVVAEIRAAPDLPHPVGNELELLTVDMEMREAEPLLREAKAAAAEHGGAVHLHLARLICNAHAACGGVEIAVGV